MWASYDFCVRFGKQKGDAFAFENFPHVTMTSRDDMVTSHCQGKFQMKKKLFLFIRNYLHSASYDVFIDSVAFGR